MIVECFPVSARTQCCPVPCQSNRWNVLVIIITITLYNIGCIRFGTRRHLYTPHRTTAHCSFQTCLVAYVSCPRVHGANCLIAIQINYEYAWVKVDFSVDKIATLPSTNAGHYLPVCVGQKVEIIENKVANLPEFSIVRLANSQQEGLVPNSILSLPLKTSITTFKSPMDSEGMSIYLIDMFTKH